MTATPASPAPRPAEASGPGDALVRVGGILFLVGAVATVVTMMPLFLGTRPFPTVAYLVCMLMAVGFVVAGVGVFKSIGAQRRLARETAARVNPSPLAAASTRPTGQTGSADSVAPDAADAAERA